MMVHANANAGNAGVLLDAALTYAARGWSIIPVVGKRAAGLWRPFQEQAADEATLRKTFAKPGITGAAVILGLVSGGLAVRDFDQADAYSIWAGANPDDAATLPTVKTARGFHVYGALDTDAYLTFGDGELRGDSRHYVLLPPSVHPDGAVYAWTIPLPATGALLPALPGSLTKGHPKQSQADPANSANPLHVLTKPGDAEIRTVVAGTLPSGHGQRNRQLFELARKLKGVIPDADPDYLREIVREWHQLALDLIRTKEFSETWADFVVAWERVKHPAGQSFQSAVEAAGSESPAVADRYDGNLRRLAALCWHLQSQWQGRPFHLSCRKAGEYLGTSHVRAWKLLNALHFDGVIELISKGKKGTGKASAWQFINVDKKGIDI